MTFGEYSRKYTCPVNRPKRLSARNRSAGVVLVAALLAFLLVLLFSTGCPPLVACVHL